ncbi:MAG: alanine--tRNA ligase [Bacteroidales bacterium]|nr:alanine--tRNA ligase [Bacteroidales bacterium]
MMTSKEIRKAYLDFFATKEHKIVPSAPMVVKNDPTLMFTNAGMNQFKDIFLGNEPAINKRVADSQKCLRVSGKHNDLEEVGHDTYHHTMFEMLGNWSFGDYFKKEIIDWAWEFLTEVMKMDKNRLYATVFEGSKEENLEADNEAKQYWLKHLPEDRVILGNKHDNFWEMGATGPCGPCSEIHVDLRSDDERAKIPGVELVNKSHPQVIEIWNLVFMQFNRKADGSLELLPAKHVDTGMGFERLCMAIQGKQSNYDTDVFQPIIQEIGRLTGIKYGSSKETDVASRVIADHIRAISFAIADGQLPANAKAGYVIRRILRRAVRYAYTFLKQNEPFLYKLLPVLQSVMGEAYPELIAQKDIIEKVIVEEETSFLRTLETGIRLLDKVVDNAIKNGKTQIDGKTVFELYDTYGFPLDLTELILREKGLTLNQSEFEAELGKQKERSRNAAKIDSGDWQEVNQFSTEDFVGYDNLVADVKIWRYRKVEAKGKNFYQIVFNQTPFYGEMGGQVGDCGYIEADGKKTYITDTQKENGLSIHIVKELPENLNATFKAVVNSEKRVAIESNHSATHLLDQALRSILGTHVEQKGSMVCSDYLRFDFSHFAKLTDEEIVKAEQFVNQKIREGISLEEHRDMPIKDAQALGAIALFGEKYGDKVRVVKFGDSIELCGGTHISNTGKIGFFKIITETAVAAGIRRIEALTGLAAEEYARKQCNIATELKLMFKAKSEADAMKSVQNLLDENTTLKKQIDALEHEKLAIVKNELLNKVENINGLNVIAQIVKVGNKDLLKDLSFQLKQQMSNAYIVLGAEFDGKPLISVIMSDNLVKERNLHAGNIVKEAGKEINGGGGGQPFYATAGGKNAAGLQNAVNKAKSFVS